MNSQEIVQDMIDFILEKEAALAANKLINESQIKNDIVKGILDKLESETKDEN